jgi:hypothetical protein
MGESVILKSSYINTTKLSAKELETRLKVCQLFLLVNLEFYSPRILPRILI